MKEELDELFGKARFIGIRSLAKYLGVSVQMVQKLVDAKKLHACRISLKIMFHRATVERYIESLVE